MNKYYKEGKKAYTEGKSYIDNPHTGAHAKNDWKAGFLAAQQMDMIKTSIEVKRG